MGTELVGPLRRVFFSDGTTRAYDLPRDTLDVRYSACGAHHLACDCREAWMAEEIAEYRLMFRQVERAILEAIKGHQTYAYTGRPGWPAEGGWSAADDFGECKCQACVIARAARIGLGECLRQRQAATERLAAAAAARELRREQRRYARNHPDLNEVPF